MSNDDTAMRPRCCQFHDPVSLSRRLNVQVGTDRKAHGRCYRRDGCRKSRLGFCMRLEAGSHVNSFEAGDARLPCTEWSEEATRTAEHRHMAGSFGLGGLSVKRQRQPAPGSWIKAGSKSRHRRGIPSVAGEDRPDASPVIWKVEYLPVE